MDLYIKKNLCTVEFFIVRLRDPNQIWFQQISMYD